MYDPHAKQAMERLDAINSTERKRQEYWKKIMDRQKIVKQFSDHILPETELSDRDVELLNAALVGLKWSRETYEYTRFRLTQIKSNNDKEIPQYE